MAGQHATGGRIRIMADGANGAPVKAGDTGTIVATPEGIEHVVVKLDRTVTRPFKAARKHGGDYMITPDNLGPE